MAVHVYITPQQVRDRMFVGTRDRLADLLNLDAGQDPLTSQQLARALEDAHAEIESYIRGRYTLPFAVIPPELTRIAFGLVKYNLLQARSDLFSDTDRLDYEDAKRDLREIADGKRQLLFPPENRTESLTPVSTVAVGSRGSDGTANEFRRTLRSF